MSRYIDTDYINQIKYIPKEQNNDLVDFSYVMDECIETIPLSEDSTVEEKVITKIPQDSFLHNLITELHKHPTPHERLKQKCPDWWFNVTAESVLKYMDELDKIDWISIFEQTIDDGYPVVVLRYRPYIVNLGNNLGHLLMKRLAYKLLCLLGLNDKYRIDGIDYVDTDKKISKTEYDNLKQSLHVQIYKEHGTIQIIFDTDRKNIDRYQRIAFNYNLLYGKNVWIHRHLIINEETGITNEFINTLDNFIDI